MEDLLDRGTVDGYAGWEWRSGVLGKEGWNDRDARGGDRSVILVVLCRLEMGLYTDVRCVWCMKIPEID